MTQHFGVISLFPEMFSGLAYGVTGRAIETSLITVTHWNPRQWGKGTYKQIDDTTYGGGPGMVMMYEPLNNAIQHAKRDMPAHAQVIYMTPQGRRLTQEKFEQCAQTKRPLIFLTGRYEGVDERIIEQHVDDEWSIGDFVLSGGELAAMACIDAITRLLPGSLGNNDSAGYDSFSDGLLEHPQYTKPAHVEAGDVPAVLLSGDHNAIKTWRRKQALGRTYLKRPELLEKVTLTKHDKQLLNEFINEL